MKALGAILVPLRPGQAAVVIPLLGLRTIASAEGAVAFVADEDVLALLAVALIARLTRHNQPLNR